MTEGLTQGKTEQSIMARTDRKHTAPQGGGGSLENEEPLPTVQAAHAFHQQQRCGKWRPKHLHSMVSCF